MEALVSVIIPAYNAVKSVRKTIESLRQQTLREIEIWVVDDGSTDGTGALLDSMQAEEPRLRVIHQTNQGCYMARLAALRQIRTPWFGFVDADDYVELTMYEEMLAFAQKNRLDVVQCGVVGGHAGGEERGILATQTEVYQKVVFPRLIAGEGAAVVWDKLYRNRFDFATFAELGIVMFEDLAFNLQFFLKAKRLGYLERNLYHYQINAGSSVKNYKPRDLRDFLLTIAYRRQQIPAYCLSIDPWVMDQWTAQNARNALITASSVRVKSWSARIANVRTLLSADEVVLAVRRLKTERHMTHSAKLLALAMRFPIGVMLGLYLLKWGQVQFSRVAG